MATDVEALTRDMLKFASLLKMVARPGPAVSIDFADRAIKLLADPSDEAMKEAREWLAAVFRHSGNNSIYDRYVVKDGEISTPLSREYLELAHKLGRYGKPSIFAANPYRVKSGFF